MKKPAHLKTSETITVKRTKAIPSRFDARKQKYEDLKNLRQMLKEKKKNNVELVRRERQRLKEKKKRKEINDLKSGSYQIIKNPLKIKKWKAKARKMLQKIPPEIFYNNIGK